MGIIKRYLTHIVAVSVQFGGVLGACLPQWQEYKYASVCGCSLSLLIKAVVKINFEAVQVWYLKAKTFTTLKYERRRKKKCVANRRVVRFRKKTA